MLVNSRMMAELGGMDEDFFLYHEEVAFSRSAQDRGWRVEYDAGVQVIHRHPLQNRAVSPKMRVIIRHSKLLYFRKHLPGWQFLGLSWIVSDGIGGSRPDGTVAGSSGGVPGMDDHWRHGPPASRRCDRSGDGRRFNWQKRLKSPDLIARGWA